MQAVFILCFAGLLIGAGDPADEGARIDRELTAAIEAFQSLRDEQVADLRNELVEAQEAAQRVGDLDAYERLGEQRKAFDGTGAVPDSVSPLNRRRFERGIEIAEKRLKDAVNEAVSAYTKVGLFEKARETRDRLPSLLAHSGRPATAPEFAAGSIWTSGKATLLVSERSGERLGGLLMLGPTAYAMRGSAADGKVSIETVAQESGRPVQTYSGVVRDGRFAFDVDQANSSGAPAGGAGDALIPVDVSGLPDGAAAPRKAGGSFRPGSKWASPDGAIVLEALAVDGGQFTARFRIGRNLDRMIVGFTDGTTVGWRAANVKEANGRSPGGDNYGRIVPAGDGDELRMVWFDPGGKGGGNLTLRRQP